MCCHRYYRLYREREVIMDNTVIKKNVVILDIMRNGSFVCQMKMPYCPLFPLDFNEVKKFVTDKKPSLRGTKFNIEFSSAAPLLGSDTNIGG